MSKRKQLNETEQPDPVEQPEEVSSELPMTEVPEERSYKESTVEETVSSESVQAKEQGTPPKEGVSSPRLSSAQEAREYVLANYKPPVGSAVVIVTSDKCVFWQENEGSAVSHAQRNNLKLFRLQWH
jgi:hypothetical protein